MLLDDLLARRLVVLSGKGGTGKSVVGAALALAASARGKRVLLVEIDAPLEASRYLGAAPVGTREAQIRPGLFAVNMDPAAVMDEYVRRTVPIDLLARRILASPVYRRFFAAAPGLPELMVMGKIMVLEEARASRFSSRPRYDLVVVDAPATGHGISFLQVPQAASEAVPLGPVGHNARRILALLRDPERTALVLVAVPEEMAAVEAQELHRAAVGELRMEPAALVLNQCHERRFTRDQEAEILRLSAEDAAGRLARGVSLAAGLDAARRHLRRRKLTQFYQTRLRRALPLPLVSLPYLFDDDIGPSSIERLAQRLEAA
jgi:anion-transporting  ArsA/GET3 family ATPase